MIEHLPQLITERAGILQEIGIDQARVEIELILCHLLDCNRLDLYLDGASRIDDELLNSMDEIIKRRATRYPLQYILQEAWFYGRKFFVSPAVMAPTPETELLCETAIRFVQQAKIPRPRVLDLGAGSGVVCVTVANELDDCAAVAVDISAEALEVARKNAVDLKAADRIDFRRSDFFSSIREGEEFDLILSNPPYISDEEYPGLPPEVLADPKIALVAGEEGLDAIKVILREGPSYLAEGGRIMFEIGVRQADKVAALTANDDRYQSLVTINDLNDIGRVIMLSCR